MNTTVLDGALYRRMIGMGVSTLDRNRKEVNDLNVFPIPDGDTGDNMFMTIRSGLEKAMALPSDTALNEMSKAVSSGMLLGARGNSGVILSRIFAGMSKGLGDSASVDVRGFLSALESGVCEAYSSVSNPVEGTILTVFKDASRAASGDDFESVFASFLKEASASLSRTPDLLPVLKEAGVIDSGGAGLVYIFEGMKDALESDAEDFGTFGSASAKPAADLDAFTEDSVLEFGYCTEFLLRLQRSKLDPDTFDVGEIRSYLNSVGESVVCFRDGSIVKVHVHTMTPGDILNHCQKWGEYLTLKIENMSLQHNETLKEKAVEGDDLVKVPHKRYAVVAVASGEGLVNAFRESGVEVVVEGGQTMNPASCDFMKAFDEAAAETIFVFPNNSNILLAAQQAAGMYDKSRVIVLPCKSIGAGYVAAASLDRSCTDVDEIVSNCISTIDSVTCCQVSKAVRDSKLEGFDVKAGDYLGFERSTILTVGNDRGKVASDLLETLGIKIHEVAIVFKGAEVPSAEAESFAETLQKQYPRTEIILTDGGQAVYDYIFALC